MTPASKRNLEDLAVASAQWSCFCVGLAALGWMIFWFFVAYVVFVHDLSPQDIEGHPTLAQDWHSVVEFFGIGLIGIPVIYATRFVWKKLNLLRAPKEETTRGFEVVPRRANHGSHG